MRRTLLILGCCIPGLLPAETVMLRKAGNPAVVTFEYITQDEETVMVRIPGRDGVLVYRWDELDQDHAKTNNPRLWEERKLLLKPGESGGMKKKSDEEDPFAVAAKPNTPQDLSRNLASELGEGLRGVSVNSVNSICLESNLDPLAFWRSYDELRKLSGRTTGTEADAFVLDPESDGDGASKQAGQPKSTKSKASSPRTPAQTNELYSRMTKAKSDYEKDVRPFSGAGYLRMLADASKARFSWTLLRRASEDRRSIIAALRRQDAAAAELSERTNDKATKAEIVTLRKAVTSLADGLEKVTRESVAMEASLTQEAQSVLQKAQLSR